MIRSCIAAIAALCLSTAALATEHDAVHVKTAGGNDAYTGLTPATPVASIGRGLAVAASSGRRKLHVAGGSYQWLTMVSGIDVIGGFDQQFVPSVTPTAASTAVVFGPVASGNLPSTVIVASGIVQATRSSGFQLRQRAAMQGRNSIGLLIANN